MSVSIYSNRRVFSPYLDKNLIGDKMGWHLSNARTKVTSVGSKLGINV